MRTRDLRAWTRWRRGPAAGQADSLLVSYTEFTPHTMRDLPAIYLAARRLRHACAELEGAVGVTVYWQIFRRRVGSISAWEDEASLGRFVSLPLHLEIMGRYRERGNLRATSWKTDSFDLSAAFEEGIRALDEGPG